MNGQTAKNIEVLEATVRGLMRTVASLAPDPDRPDYKGPLFVAGTEPYTPPAEYEGMAGNLMMEGVLAPVFQAATHNISAPVNFSNTSEILEAVDEFYSDRKATREQEEKIERYNQDQKSALRRGFNRLSSADTAFQAFWRDMPRRLGLEGWIAECLRDIAAVRHATHLGLQIPVPAP